MMFISTSVSIYLFREGPGVFYDGYIGENLVKDVQENNQFNNRKRRGYQ